jgi:transcriptional regulator with XRE-family HTH domain
MAASNRLSSRQIFAQNLRRERLARKWTQEELALQVGITQGYLSEMESGVRNVSLDMLDQVAAALHTHPDEMLRRRKG